MDWCLGLSYMATMRWPEAICKTGRMLGYVCFPLPDRMNASARILPNNPQTILPVGTCGHVICFGPVQPQFFSLKTPHEAPSNKGISKAVKKQQRPTEEVLDLLKAPQTTYWEGTSNHPPKKTPNNFSKIDKEKSRSLPKNSKNHYKSP